MTKTLTEQWRDGGLSGWYYLKDYTGKIVFRHLSGVKPDADFVKCFTEVLAPVPSYGSLYNPNDGNIPVGLFTVLKLIKRDIEQYQKTRPLTDLECGIKSQVVSLLKRRCCDLGKDELVSNSDELSRKTLQLEKKLVIATKALEHCQGFDFVQYALKEMEGVK